MFNPFKFSTDKALADIAKLLKKLDAAATNHLQQQTDHLAKADVHGAEAERALRVADKFRDLVS